MARTDAWIEEYWEQGFAFVRGVFPPAETAELSRCFDEILALGRGPRKAMLYDLAYSGMTGDLMA